MILVTGGAGYIGSHTVRALVQKGFEVLVVDDLSRGSERLLWPGVKFVKARVHDREVLKSILTHHNVEAVIHFAAYIDSSESTRDPDRYIENNYVGTVQLLSSLAELSPKSKLVFSSTAAVYAPRSGVLIRETDQLGPVTPYGESKLRSEEVLEKAHASWGLDYTVLRYFNVGGASHDSVLGPVSARATGLVRLAAMVSAGKAPSLHIFGEDYETVDGTGVRDYIHVEDLAELHVRALEPGKTTEPRVFNCGYGYGFSVLEVVRAMEQVAGKPLSLKKEGRRPGDLASVVADPGRLLTHWGWKPRFSELKLICESSLAWEQKNR